jgi:hypothetical protein
MDDKSGRIEALLESDKKHMAQFAQIKGHLNSQDERIGDLEAIFLQHSKRSQANQSFMMLLFGLFAGIAAIAMFGLSIEGSFGNSKISYSSNSFVQLVTGILTIGGSSVAVDRYKKIKSQIKK